MTINLLAALLLSTLVQPPLPVVAPVPPPPPPPVLVPAPPPPPPPPPPPSIEVEVRNALTSRVIDAAVVVMDIGVPPHQRRRTRTNGRTRFEVACTEDMKFWAELPDDPNFPNQSPQVACQPQITLVTLKLRPNRR